VNQEEKIQRLSLRCSLAAARGGYVAVSAMANTLPVADTAAIVEQVAAIG